MTQKGIFFETKNVPDTTKIPASRKVTQSPAGDTLVTMLQPLESLLFQLF